MCEKPNEMSDETLAIFLSDFWYFRNMSIHTTLDDEFRKEHGIKMIECFGLKNTKLSNGNPVITYFGDDPDINATTFDEFYEEVMNYVMTFSAIRIVTIFMNSAVMSRRNYKTDFKIPTSFLARICGFVKSDEWINCKNINYQHMDTTVADYSLRRSFIMKQTFDTILESLKPRENIIRKCTFGEKIKVESLTEDSFILQTQSAEAFNKCKEAQFNASFFRSRVAWMNMGCSNPDTWDTWVRFACEANTTEIANVHFNILLECTLIERVVEDGQEKCRLTYCILMNDKGESKLEQFDLFHIRRKYIKWNLKKRCERTIELIGGTS